MSDNLFEDLKGMRHQLVKVLLQPGARVTNPHYDPRVPGSPAFVTEPATGTKPITFEIHSVSANEIIDAESRVTARPQAIYQEEASPSGRGTVQVRKGYDHEDPAYVAERQKQIPLQQAAICLYGCPALRETTPGMTLDDKIKSLVSMIPGAIIDWLCGEIGAQSILTAVGEEAVESFLAPGSATARNLSATAGQTPRKKKRPSSQGSTPPTSTTKSGKRRTTGG